MVSRLSRTHCCLRIWSSILDFCRPALEQPGYLHLYRYLRRGCGEPLIATKRVEISLLGIFVMGFEVTRKIMFP